MQSFLWHSVHAFISSPPRLLQQFTVRCTWKLDEKAAGSSECRSSCYDGDKEVVDHITPILRELQWLPVRERIVYKLAVIVFKCLHGLAPPYLADDCVPVIHSRVGGISCLLSPVASLSLDLTPQLTREASQSPVPKYGTVFRPTYDFTHSHYIHLDRGWSISCLWAVSASEDFLSCAIQFYALLSTHAVRQGVDISVTVCVFVFVYLHGCKFFRRG